ncbi:MAG: protein disulfide oxidoreductase [Gammaproteobacteria bacterium]
MSDERKPPKKTNRARSWLIYGSLFFVVFMAVSTIQTRNLLEGPAPEFEAFTLAGPYFSLKERRGEPLIVHFWATWCPVCKAEEGTINSLAEDADIITIAMQSGDHAEVAKHMRDRELKFPVIVDEDGSLSRQYRVRGVPTTYILDSNGEIRFSDVGFATEAGLRARYWLAKEAD